MYLNFKKKYSNIDYNKIIRDNYFRVCVVKSTIEQFQQLDIWLVN